MYIGLSLFYTVRAVSPSLDVVQLLLEKMPAGDARIGSSLSLGVADRDGSFATPPNVVRMLEYKQSVEKWGQVQSAACSIQRAWRIHQERRERRLCQTLVLYFAKGKENEFSQLPGNVQVMLHELVFPRIFPSFERWRKKQIDRTSQYI